VATQTLTFFTGLPLFSLNEACCYNGDNGQSADDTQSARLWNRLGIARPRWRACQTYGGSC
jgi:hypothetical protein